MAIAPLNGLRDAIIDESQMYICILHSLRQKGSTIDDHQSSHGGNRQLEGGKDSAMGSWLCDG